MAGAGTLPASAMRVMEEMRMAEGITAWLDEATPDRREVTVCLDRRLLSQLVTAKAELKEAQEQSEGMLGKAEPVTALEARISELEDAVRERSKTLIFDGLGWGAWRELVAKHPPADDQAEVFARAVGLAFMPHAVENVGYNAETLVPAAISASCSDPGISVHEADTLLRKAPPGVIERIWTAVLEVNLGGNTDPFVAAVSGNGSGTAHLSPKR